MWLTAITQGEGFDERAWSLVLDSGIDALMIREKQMDARTLLQAAHFCRKQFPHVELWINGREDIAALAACGFHAPEKHPIIGCAHPLSRPLHDLTDFEERKSANQFILSPVYAVPGKGKALGISGLHQWLDTLPPFPGRILALGGLKPGRIQGIRHPRLHGLAMIRAFWEGNDPQALVKILRSEWEL